MYLSKRIHVFYTYCIPNESKIHFGIRMRYIKIHVSCTWGTCGIHVGYMRDTYEIHVSAEVRGYMEDTCGIHEGYIMRYMYLGIRVVF